MQQAAVSFDSLSCLSKNDNSELLLVLFDLAATVGLRMLAARTAAIHVMEKGEICHLICCNQNSAESRLTPRAI